MKNHANEKEVFFDFLARIEKAGGLVVSDGEAIAITAGKDVLKKAFGLTAPKRANMNEIPDEARRTIEKSLKEQQKQNDCGC